MVYHFKVNKLNTYNTGRKRERICDRMIPIRNFAQPMFSVPTKTDNKKEDVKGIRTIQGHTRPSRCVRGKSQIQQLARLTLAGGTWRACVHWKNTLHTNGFFTVFLRSTTRPFLPNLCIPEMAFNGLFSDVEEGKKYLYFSQGLSPWRRYQRAHCLNGL